MTEQERNTLLNELRQQEGQREKQIKRERFRRLNPYAKKGAVVFAGSSLMEQFPVYEFLQDDDLHCTLYNRGIGGFTTTELLEALDECIFELQPAHLFLNIGTNDLNGPDYDRTAMLGRYEEILQKIKERLPETKRFRQPLFLYSSADHLRIKTPTAQPTMAHSSANPDHDSRTLRSARRADRGCL